MYRGTAFGQDCPSNICDGSAALLHEVVTVKRLTKLALSAVHKGIEGSDVTQMKTLADAWPVSQ